jgi:predicted site-specific integrase-resolvase
MTVTDADIYDPAMPDTDWITRAEAAELLGVRPASVDRYCDRGQIERRKNEITKLVRLKRADVEQLRKERAGES